MRSKKKIHKNRYHKVVEIPSPKVEEASEIQIMPVAVPIDSKNEASKENLKTKTTATVGTSRPAPVSASVVLENIKQPLEVVSIPEVLEDIKQPAQVVSIPKVLDDIKQPLEVDSTPKVLEGIKQPREVVSIPEVLKDIKHLEVVSTPEVLVDIKKPLEVVSTPEVLVDIKKPPEVVSTPEVLENIKHPLDNIKHPLENSWSIWLNTNDKSKNWTENQKHLVSFDTVEDYWCLYHHMKLPSEQRQGQDFAIFKEGISPMWEDDANKDGGRWLVNLDRRGGGEMDRIWLDVVLLMIGENFPNNDAIRGAVVNVKPKSRVSVWTRSKDAAENMEIGRKLKEILRINFKIQFMDHKSNVTLYVI